eukprot:c14617_g1_i1.p1 GENE.c14617_g1_i1~~c14617_g1_i1.p1  ORF type:complete len:669 (+),score=140.14 c14617_g1_i1:556-2562(+)
MMDRETKSPACGLLADEQGLGKTIQMVALILAVPRPTPPTDLPANKHSSSSSQSPEQVESDFECQPPQQQPLSRTLSSPSLASSSASPSQQPLASTATRRPRPSMFATSFLAPSHPTAPPPAPKPQPQSHSQTLAQGGTLVVCPLTVAQQWCKEVTKCAGSRLHTYLYHGAHRKKVSQLERFDVVVTTYQVVAQECEFAATASANGPAPKRPRRDAGTLFQMHWHRIVLDEGHCIRNPRTKTAQACTKLRADRRWILSGTPVQNSLNDLYSLLRFLRFAPTATATPDQFSALTRVPSNLERILVEVMKRRTKESLVDGKRLLELPPKKLIDECCELSPEERAVYNTVADRASLRIRELENKGTAVTIRHVLGILMKLRLACNHPFLCLDKASRDLAPPKASAGSKEVPFDATSCESCLADTDQLTMTSCGHVLCQLCCTAGEGQCVSCGATLDNFQPQSSETQPNASSSTPPTAAPEPSLGRDYISTKMRVLLNCLGDFAQSAASSATRARTIVFSQWVCTLDLLVPVLARSFVVFRVDGQMSLSQRDSAIQGFQSHDGFAVLLMSLHAGCLGLNLTAASNVVLIDSWWNPAVEEQAIDRVHRIGQTVPVNIRKIITKDTIEDRVIAIQHRKIEAMNKAYAGHKLQSALSKFTAEELRELLSTRVPDS